jgi:hypothetical protein
LTVKAESASTLIYETPVSDIQSDVVVSGNKITGTLKYLEDGPIAGWWGAGNFLALKFADLDPNATSIKVGLNPSQGSGLVEIIGDPDMNGVFKITDKDVQTFRVVITDGHMTKTTDYDLSDLTVLDS